MADDGQGATAGLDSIAVVGMAGRFPGAGTLEQFWANLRDGVESVSFFSPEELTAAGVTPAELADPHYVGAGAVLADVEAFDAGFFGYYPREAEILDPQQRVFLECAYEALERAGYDPARAKAAIGVYAGAGMNTYMLLNLFANRDIREAVHPYHLVLGNDKDFLATRAAYKLNLRGPAVTVQTACSTSLVAVHFACQGLLNYQCDMALAGGVSVRLPQTKGYLYQEGGIGSPDGHCRAFDAAAGGTVSGNGVGIVVLKRLADAEADGDRILAVIRGSAINNDGSLKVGFTAPSVDGQAEVIANAQFLANVTPDTIDYVEAHGTGTALGDPIEIAALSQVFEAGGAAPQSCAIGSLKTNIGHLDAAAGVAGLIKTVLALQHEALPPSLHYERPNPKANLERSPFRVNAALTPWPRGAAPRRAGVSSFGLGGTNAHVVVEEAPEADHEPSARPAHLLLLSARSEAALDAATVNLAAHLRAAPALDLADAAYTSQVGRGIFAHRRAVVATSAAAAADALETLDAGAVRSGQAAAAPQVAFLFTGQGAQHVGMGRELYATEPVFREQIDRCAERLRPALGLDLRDVLYPTPETADEAARQLDQTRVTQPALFAVEYALAELWLSRGVRPTAMLGHSVGEYVAACVAGVFSLEDALDLVAERGRLMQSMAPGAMLSVPLAEAALVPLLVPGVDLAALNAPGHCVVAGPAEAIDAFDAMLRARGVEGRRLRTSHAFHSAMMEPVVRRFAELVASFERRPPAVPFVSNLTGTWITFDEAMDPAYWARHLRNAVRFADGVATLLAESDRVLLEVGPGKTLATLARMQPDAAARTIVASLPGPRDPRPEYATFLGALAELWTAGVNPEWETLYGDERRRRVPLPTYPFERRRYWVEPDAAGAEPARASATVRRADPAEWLYQPSWKRLDLPADTAKPRGAWLVLCAGPLGRAVAGALRAAGLTPVVVEPGPGFRIAGGHDYAIDPASPADYERLLATLAERGIALDGVAHLWGADREGDDFDAAQRVGYYPVLHLTRALARAGVTRRLELAVVTRGVQEVTGDETLDPAGATVMGPMLVVPQEYPNIVSRAIDVAPGAGPLARLAERIVEELGAGAAERVVALRGAHRWVESFEPTRPGPTAVPAVRDGGVYLITGGLGRLGLAWAEYLAAAAAGVKLVLLGRRVPAPGDPREARIAALEAAGARVVVETADVADAAALAAVVARTEACLGPLCGVIHAAGLVGHVAIKPVAETGVAESEAQFRAKVRGLAALDAALAGRTLDFVLLQSSLAATLGGMGFTAYAAANRFMDTWAQQRARDGAPRWTSVCWDGWAFADDLVRAESAAAKAAFALAIREEEARRAFHAVLGAGRGAQLLVSTADLPARAVRRHAAAELAAAEGAGLETGATTPKRSRHPRPAMRTAYAAPRSELEREIIGAWEQVLGIEGIGADDDFFELGGHSLLATQLVSRLRDTFQVELPLARLFETPTPAGLAALVEAGRGAPAAAGTATRIVPVPRDGELPLSFGQQRLWFLDQLEPGSALYNNPAAVRLSGPLDDAALERSLNEIVRRHEVLRTTVHTVDGQPVQRVHAAVEVPVARGDLSALPASEREAAALRAAAEDAAIPFDLGIAPLLRCRLLRLDAEEHVALLTMHHIVSDGWSTGVLLHELAALYSAYTTGREPELSPLAVQYADFAAWQRRWLTGDVRAAQVAYWRARLGDEPPPLALPTDRPRGRTPSQRGATEWFTLAPELVRAVKTFSHGADATPFMTLLAAFQALLARYTGQRDIAVGTPIANRNRGETEALIGFFVNTLVLRSDLSDDPSFRTLVARVRTDALGAYAHQDLPFETLVEELQPKRDLGRPPFFQVMFVLQNAPMQALELPGVVLTPLGVDPGTAKFDLTLCLEEAGDGMRGSIVYDSDLFDAATIHRLIGHFERLLAAAVADADRSVAELPMLAPAEEARIVDEWAGSDAAAPFEPIIAAFARQAARTPAATAVEQGAVRLSYAELDARANRLAHHLRALGVGAESLVGVCLERSPELVVALLGIFKAGAAYLPLDPSYPAPRLGFMLADAKAPVLLTHGRAAEGLDPHGATIVRLDADWSAIAVQPATAPAVETRPGHLAYVIYTSGSTGIPKGVEITHGALAAHCAAVREHFALTPADRVLQFAAVSFDPSLEQLLPTLTSGATVVLRDAEIWAATDVSDRIAELGLTVVNVPPAYWQQWTQAMVAMQALQETRTPAHLARLVIVGGDLVTADTVRAWQTTPYGSVRLLNAYGPTETTITATTYDVPAGFAPASGRVPIGRPLGPRVVRIVDARGQAVPVGVAGELWIGGACVARGYRGRGELTEEKFVALAATETGRHERFYRTGDLARWMGDGAIEFLGRGDQQVKVRGFRIELGEIESVLRLHPAVADAAVAAREDARRPGERRLAAYVVPAGPAPDAAELRAFLRERLPDYMVPADIVTLDALPLGASGKVDRAALPAPEGGAAAAYVAPRDEVERELAGIWTEVLGVERVGVHDNFFDLGGHSLLATQLVSRVRAAFQIELPLRELFQAATVAELAVLVAQQLAAGQDDAELAALLAELEDLPTDGVKDLLVDGPGSASN